MNYPEKTILVRPLRVAIMLVEVLIFLIISPTIILYTSGYRIDWHNWKIEKTGVISIDVLPSNAQVFLNTMEIMQRLPIRLTNRSSGTYHLKISAPGFLSWEKDITVINNLTTYIKQVSLFRQSVPKLIFEGEKIVSIYPSENGEYILYVRENQDTFEINLLDVEAKKTTPIVRTKNFSDIKIVWSTNSANAAINLTHDKKNTIYLFSTDNPVNIAAWEYKTKKIEFAWNESSSKAELHVKMNNSIHAVTLEASNSIFDTPSTTTAWCVSNKNLLWLYDNFDKKFYTPDSSFPSISYSNDEVVAKILICDESRLIAQTNASLLGFPLDNTANKLPKIQGSSVIFNKSTSEWLSWSDSELWTMYPNDDTALLERIGEKITSILPIDNYGVLLIETKNSLIAFNPGYYVSNTLFESGQIEKTAVNQKQRKILFLGTVGQKRGLYELDY